MKTFLVPSLVLFVIDKLEEAGFEAYMVGGAVRDLLVGKEMIRDWDVTTNARPEETLELFEESFYDNEFGTVMVAPKHVYTQMCDEKGIEIGALNEEEKAFDVLDITTFRSESGYSDRRKPDKVVWGESIEEDVKRRDFTINALALKFQDLRFKIQETTRVDEVVEVEAEVVDFFGGVSDLEKKLVRTVGDANERFEEDALRMMRAIRFGAQLGFSVEEKTLEAIQKNAGLLVDISWERIRDELMKIVASEYPADGVLLLHSAGLLQYILPELEENIGIKQGGHHIYDVWKHSIESLRECPSRDPIVRLATLLHDIGKAPTVRYQGPRGVTFYGHEVVGARMVKKIAERLRLSKKDKEKLFTLVRWHMFNYQPEMTDSAIKRFIRRVGVENINDMMMLRIGDRKGGGSKATSWRLRELQRRIGENLYEPMSVRDLRIDGHDLMSEFGLKPGPVLGRILNGLFEEVMEDRLVNDQEALLLRAKEILSEEGAK